MTRHEKLNRRCGQSLGDQDVVTGKKGRNVIVRSVEVTLERLEK